MLRKLIIALCLIGGLSYGQSTSGWSIVTTEGTNLYQDGAILAAGITNYFKPAYGSLSIASEPFVVATNSTVTNGTVTAGSVTNTWIMDADYYEVTESGQFEIYFEFTNTVGSVPKLVNFHGRYDGNPAHNVVVEMYDFVDGAYESLTGAASDVPSSATDNSFQWVIPAPNTNYISAGGISYFRFRHTSAAVGSHVMYMDYLAMIYANVTWTNAGDWIDIAGATLGASNNITIDASAGYIKTIDAGTYRTGWYTSFTGSSNTVFTIRHLTNGVTTGTEMWRSIGSSPAIGSASAFGYTTQGVGVTNSWQVRADTDYGWFTIVNGHAEVNKVGN